MDEILASIRRIIADEDPGQLPPKGSEPQFSSPSRPADPQPDMDRPAPMRASAPPMERTREDEIDSMLARLQAARPAPAEVDPGVELGAAEPASHEPIGDDPPDRPFEDSLPEPRTARPAGEQRPAPEVSDRGLLSGATVSAVDSAFHELAHTVQVRNGRTLEDFVAELLRPMLKTWLDENLPDMVERLVRAEIERVSRGRG